MNKKMMFWIMTLALAAAPVFAAAQEGPGFDEDDDMEMSQPGGPGMGQGGPGMQQDRPGMQQGMRPGMQQRGMDQRQPMNKKAMRGGKGGNQGFVPEKTVLAIIKKNDPAFFKKVEELRETAPAKYKMVIQMSAKLLNSAKMEQDESVERDAVKGLALEYESRELSLKYNKASDSEKKEIKSRLKTVLSDLFDVKTRGQELRTKHMAQEIDRLNKRLEKRKANKSKIVDQRVDQLTGEGYGW
jgi:hypothetical protein